MPVVKVIPQKLTNVGGVNTSQIKNRRVAAYARVSTDSDEQFTSFEAQVDYYTQKIAENPNWTMVEVYTDEGITGTNILKREGFNRMINDALNGKIDLILTKSVSRFARNTVDSIITIRKLKEKGVEVFFEKENIYTLDSKGELLITLMSSLAQEESRSISENVTWAFRKKFKDGKIMMSYKNFLGYDRGEDGQPVINEEEALIVRDIYRWFLEGESCYVIAERLNQNKVPMPSKKIDKETGEYVYKWQCSTVLSILTNEKYKGEAVLQKTVTVDFLTHKHKKNEGEAPQYHVIDSHEAIVEPIEWELVQDELKRREEAKYGKHSATSVFSSKIVCGECGSFYGQKVWHSNDKYRSLIYRCNNKFNKKKFCSTPTLKEEGIKAAFIKSFNTLQNENKVEDLLLMIEEVKDTSKIDSDMVDAQTELDVTLELANKMIKENASTAQDQEEYQKKYQRLEKRSDELIEKLKNLEAEKTRKKILVGRINLLISNLIDKDTLITEFDPRLFSHVVEKVVVTQKEMRFVYFAGYENVVVIH